MLLLIVFNLTSCSFLINEKVQIIRSPSNSTSCNLHFEKLTGSDPFEDQLKSFDILTNYFDNYFSKGIPYTDYHGIEQILKIDYDLAWINNYTDELGNIIENCSHPLLRSRGFKLQAQIKPQDFFNLHLHGLTHSNFMIGNYTFFEGLGAYVSINMKLLKKKMSEGALPKIFTNAFDDYLNFLENIYAKKLGINSEKFAKLRLISKELADRSSLHFHTHTRLFKDTYNPNFTPQNFFPIIYEDMPDYLSKKMNYVDNYFYKDQTIGEHFNFTSGIISVLSRSKDEKLPMEIIHGIELPRFGGLQIAEVGRMSSTISPEEALSLVKITAVNLARGWYEELHKVKKIFIEVDEVRRRHFKRYGFKDFRVNEDLGYYRSGTDYILEADINEFLTKALEVN